MRVRACVINARGAEAYPCFDVVYDLDDVTFASIIPSSYDLTPKFRIGTRAVSFNFVFRILQYTYEPRWKKKNSHRFNIDVVRNYLLILAQGKLCMTVTSIILVFIYGINYDTLE